MDVIFLDFIYFPFIEIVNNVWLIYLIIEALNKSRWKLVKYYAQLCSCHAIGVLKYINGPMDIINPAFTNISQSIQFVSNLKRERPLKNILKPIIHSLNNLKNN